MRLFRRNDKLNLALQGGGAHGAFTWGVLDRLLEEPDIDIGWISGTSAGAVNAVAVAAGMLTGGREGARDKLREVWLAVHKAGVPDLLKLNPFLFGLTRSASVSQVTSLWSPYDLNPLGFDPFRTLLEKVIDFEAIRAASSSPIELLLAATDVSTGRARLFRRAELTVEVVLASACLPTLHRAVVIDNRLYWDGGFSSNPDIITLALESPIADTLIVQLSPLHKRGFPTGAREIAAYTNRITFNAPLARDVAIIETARETLGGRFGPRRGRLTPLATHRFHLIESGRHTGSLSDDSKLKPDLELLTYLHGAGREQAALWLLANRRAIGRRSSVDLRQRFLVPEQIHADEVADATAADPPEIEVTPAERRSG